MRSYIILSALLLMAYCTGCRKNFTTDVGMSGTGDSIAAAVAKPVVIESVWDYYPVSTEVISVNAVSQNGFNADETYRLETLRDSLWVDVALDSLTGISYGKVETDDTPCHVQNVMLKSSAPLVPGVYRALRIGEASDTAAALFEVLSGNDVVKRLNNGIIMDYFSADNVEKDDTICANIYSWGDAKVYPDTVSEVTFFIHNKSERTLCYGTPYTVARKTDGHWEELYQGGVWTMPLYGLNAGASSEFMKANLHRLINDITPGEYIIYKNVYFDGDKDNAWNISARFTIK